MYTFKNTEINNKKSSDFETKSMLYLLGMREDSDEIEFITVDCFNDVTGINPEFSKLWDIQSKNHSSLPPSKIGESLFTLYDNYVSKIDFFEYILFIPPLNRDYLKNTKLSTYKYNNINDKQKIGIEKKLKEKINKNTSTTTPPLFYDFLDSVYFVEDTNKISHYIKKLSQFKNKRSIPELIYENIFNEIKNRQSSLKNTYIENLTINHPNEVLKLNRHFTKREINTLLINRLVGIDVFANIGIPIPFMKYIADLDEEDTKDLIQECNSNLSRAFFDKNSCKLFWKLSEMLITSIKENPTLNTENIFSSIQHRIQKSHDYLNEITIKYMISLIKSGLENDHK